MKTNGKNERIKHRYFEFLQHAKRQSVASIDAAAEALDRFETFTKRQDFAKFHIEQATAFKLQLAKQVNQRTGKTLSKATQLHTLSALKAFFFWLADQQGFKSRIGYSDADYFNMSLKDMAVAKVDRDVQGPTIEQVRHVLSKMPFETDIEKRDRAMIAFTLMTAARDNAIASLRMKHISLSDGLVVQDARDVRTKASKTITTVFVNVGDEVKAIFVEWVEFLINERKWGLDDPLFPATRVTVGANRRFEASGLDRKCWSSAAPIRSAFRVAFEAAGLPYFNPHSFRHTLARLGAEICSTPEEYKAWSMNLGHEKVLTTLTSYGSIEPRRQAEIIRSLGAKEGAAQDREAARIAQEVFKLMQGRSEK